MWLGLAACTASAPEAENPAPSEGRSPVTVRVASFNVAMYRSRGGQLVADLKNPRLAQGRSLAALLQRVRPDVLLLNEVDYDAEGQAIRLLIDNFLAVPQGDDAGLSFPYVEVPPTNTGEASGLDLDRNGVVGVQPGTADYGGDAFGYGEYPGKYGLAVLSRYPLGSPRTFRHLKWRDVPGNQLPTSFYGEEISAVLRLSSKTHLDLPIDIEGRTVHLLASHPTPPGFDGAEDRNGRRNADEIRLWTQYLDEGSASDWLVDDQGRSGGLGTAPFVIVGDLNADPADGDGADAIRALLDHPRVADPEPRSVGGAEQAGLQRGANVGHVGDPALDTSDFADTSVGNLRVDYALPCTELTLQGAGVFWPGADEPEFAWVGTFPFPISDHRLVWVDVEI